MNLYDDILIHIFEYLSIKENLKIRTVCKKWNEVLTYVFLQTKHVSFDNSSTLNSFCVMDSLPKLTSIKFDDMCPSLIRQFIEMESSNILRFKVDKMICWQIEKIMCNFPNAKEIICDEIMCVSKESTTNILRSDVLKYKCMKICYALGPELKLLHGSLTELNLENSYPRYVPFSTWFEWICIKPRICLRVLNCWIDLLQLDDVCSKFTNLVSLTLTMYQPDFVFNYNPISSLVNLEYLNLQPRGNTLGPFILDESAACIFKGCKKLKKLRLWYTQLGTKSIKYLSKMENMESIVMHFSILDVEPETIQKLSKLKTLREFDFEGTLPENSDINLSKMFESCLNLVYIHIYYISQNNLNWGTNVIGQSMYNACYKKAEENTDENFELTVSKNVLVLCKPSTENCKAYRSDSFRGNHQVFSFFKSLF
jgi:hypothetical protein